MGKSADSLIRKYFSGVNPPVKGVFHIGAHLCEEQYMYTKLEIKNIVWVDYGVKPHREENNVFISAIVADTEEPRKFYVSGNSDGASSSLFPFKEILDVYNGRIYVGQVMDVVPETVDGIFTKNNLDMYDYNAMIMHTNGADILILNGAKDFIKHLDYIGVYYYWRELFEGVPFEKDMDEYMEKIGFAPRYKFRWKNGYGNGLYVRSEVEI